MPIRYSVVVPAYKEKLNLEPLTKRVFAAMEEGGYAKDQLEIIIVDDNSRDGSEELVEGLKKDYNVSILVRTTERGLSSAVLHGLKNCSGDSMVVMDADLQHPPESVPAMFRELERATVQFVCGTRYSTSVKIDKDWPLHRRIISWGARILARPLTALSDPMSGFFGLRRSTYESGVAAVSPIGYKIALELFVKCNVTRFEEVPFNFATRTHGESKLTGKVMLYYLKHLYALYYYCMGLWLYVVIAVVLLGAMEFARVCFYRLFA